MFICMSLFIHTKLYQDKEFIAPALLLICSTVIFSAPGEKAWYIVKCSINIYLMNEEQVNDQTSRDLKIF